MPHSGTLEKLAKAHGHTVEAYMDALAKLSKRRPLGRKHRETRNGFSERSQRLLPTIEDAPERGPQPTVRRPGAQAALGHAAFENTKRVTRGKVLQG